MQARTYFRDLESRESRANGYQVLVFNVATSSSPRKYAGRSDRRTSRRLEPISPGRSLLYKWPRDHLSPFAKIALPWQTPAEFVAARPVPARHTAVEAPENSNGKRPQSDSYQQAVWYVLLLW